MQNVVLLPVFPPNVKVGVGTVSSKEKAALKCLISSASVQLHDVIRNIPSVCTIEATLSRYLSLSRTLLSLKLTASNVPLSMTILNFSLN